MSAQRLFIAADISEDQRSACADVLTRLGKAVLFTKAHPKWVAPAVLHVTMKFLGDVEEERIPALIDALTEPCSQTPVFEFSLGGLGVFPDERQPKVIWMGVRRGGEALGALQRRVDATLEGLGFPLETRPFHGHLTLARVNSMRDTKALIDIVRGQKNLEAGASILERLTLYKSDLGPAGPTYTALRHWPLGAKPADAPSAPQLDA